jgi:hypothetical protein
MFDEQSLDFTDRKTESNNRDEGDVQDDRFQDEVYDAVEPR